MYCGNMLLITQKYIPDRLGIKCQKNNITIRHFINYIYLNLNIFYIKITTKQPSFLFKYWQYIS